MPDPNQHLIMMDLLFSLMRFCTDWAANEEGQMLYEDFDAHADDSSVPPGDLIGTSGFTLTVDHPFVSMDVMIGIATEGDTNIIRLRTMVARLFQRLQPTQKIDVIDYKTGVKKGFLIVQDGVRLLPVGSGSTRPIQYIMVGFQTDCFA